MIRPRNRAPQSLLASAVSIALCAGAHAQIATDTTLGAATALSGPAYLINATLGRQIGGNLFHSFSTFNLAAGESATFAGPGSVTNVISRVTGGSASSIDGLIRSTIAGANVFLINPKGIVFGPNASLDLTGSFHASTADYVRLADGGRFDATNPAASVLTSAPPEAFGFLDRPPALLRADGSRLETAAGKSLSLVGGHVTLFDARLTTNGGDLHVASLASEGEVPVSSTGAITGSRLGELSIGASQITAQSAPGVAPGRIVIRGGTLSIFGSTVASDNTEAAPAGPIRIAVSDSIFVDSASTVASAASGAGTGAALNLSAGYISGFDLALRTSTTGPGSGGDLSVTASTFLSLHSFGSASISTSTSAAGRGGTISVEAASLEMANGRSVIATRTEDAGPAGDLSIRAGSVRMGERSSIASLATAGSSGATGAITVAATTGVTILGDGSRIDPTRIETVARGSGNGGDIAITTPLVTLDGGAIRTSASGGGTAGRILLGSAAVELRNGGRIDEDLRGRVVLDGSFGSSASLAGPNFNITDDLGMTVGNNLFHSFLAFDVLTGERATFSGPGSIAHVIARVTGPEATFVDGTLATTIPGASLWLVNPRGMLFGPNARLDLAGAFHASSADYVRLGSDGRFDARTPGASVLTASAPEAFGFGASAAGAIEVVGARLEGSDGASLSLVGGNVTVSSDAQLRTRGGDLRVVSAAGAGEIPLAGDSTPTAGTALGTITINASNLAADSATGLPPGRIVVRGGRIETFGATIGSSNTETGDAGEIVVASSERFAPFSLTVTSTTSGTGRGADVRVVSGDAIELDGQVRTRTDATGRGGDVVLTAPTIAIVGEIRSETTSSGRGGNIALNGDDVTVTGSVGTLSTGSGRGGDATVAATTFRLSGGTLTSSTTDAGRGGDLRVDADTIEIGGGEVRAGTQGDGTGGNVALAGTTSVLIAGTVATTAEGNGPGGAVTISAPAIEITSGSVHTTAAGNGPGGSVSFLAGSLALSDRASVTTLSSADGASGAIEVDAVSVTIGGRSVVSTRTDGAGASGTVTLRADTVELSGQSRIESTGGTGSTGAPGALAMNVTTGVTILGDGSRIDPTRIETVARGSGNGGDIAFTTPLVTLDGGAIRTSASGGGTAGRILLGRAAVELRNGGRIDEDLRGRVVLDGSLGSSASLAGPNFTITDDLGMTVGNNLFHSFLAFDVLAGERATFSGPGSIAHVIARVTGTEASFVDGTLATTIPGASLWLVNPRGMLFGPNARLDLSGSFHASSADYVRLGSDGRFDARTPAASVLTASAPEAFGFGASPAGAIEVIGARLEGSEGASLALIGGEVKISADALLRTRGGDLRVASVAGAGEVALAGDSAPAAGTAMGTVTINTATLAADSAPALPPGRIVVRGGDVRMVDGAVTSTNSGTGAAGGIVVAASGALELRSVTASTAGSGSGAPITVTAETVAASDIRSRTTGTGTAGDIAITATRDATVRFIDTQTDGLGNGANTVVRAPDVAVLGANFGGSRGLGARPAGNFTFEGERITFGGSLTTETAGAGDAGNVSLRATQSIDLADGQIASGTGGTGRGGDIRMQAPDVRLDGGFARLSSSTSSFGPSGTIDIRGARVAISNGVRVLTESEGLGTGQAGNVEVRATERIEITKSADAFTLFFTTLSSSLRGDGRAGDVLLSAPRVRVTGDSVVTSDASNFFGTGGGQGGTVRIRGDEIEIGAAVSAATFDGRGGSVDVRGRSLTLTRDGALSTQADGHGSAGAIVVDMTGPVLIDGVVTAGALDRSSGGAISITAPMVTVAGAVTASTDGGGRGGAITLTAPTLSVAGGGVTSITRGAADAGEISLRGDTISVTAGGLVSSSGTVLADGNAGPITIAATDSFAATGRDALGVASAIRSRAFGAGRGGSIFVTAPALTLDQAIVESRSFGFGDAGNVTLRGGRIEMLAGGRVDAGVTLAGRGGTVDVAATESLLIRGRDVLSSGPGATVFGDPGGILSRTSGSGRAGDVIVSAPSIRIEDGGAISTASGFASATGDAGNIRIAGGSVALSSSAALLASTITTSTEGAGRGGNIAIAATTVDLGRGGALESRSTGSGAAGAIEVTATDALRIFGGRITTEAISSDGGDVTIRAGRLVHLRDGEITTSVGSGHGSGGNISIDPTFVILESSRIVANAFGGAGGSIDIVADFFLPSADSLVDASSTLGVSGSVQISAPRTEAVSGLPALPSQFFDASALLREACAGRGGTGSRLLGVGRGGTAVSPYGYAVSRYFDFPARPEPATGDSASIASPAQARARTLFGTRCEG